MQHSDLDSKRIAVLLSGGVDSSVVVYEFARLGLHPDCFYIKIGPEEEEAWDCSSEEDLEMATAVAHKYGCNLEVIDCHREYWEQVTRYTMEKVRAGFTPNPDVMCNRLIKFGAFDEKRGHDYDLIATGHYAQTEIDEAGLKWLVTSPDPVKDQTDFLAQIYDWQLRKAIFPIGHYMKDEVRQIAEREHLVNAKRKDSPHHRPAQGHGLLWWPLVRHQKRRPPQHPLRLPRLQPRLRLQDLLPHPRPPLAHPSPL